MANGKQKITHLSHGDVQKHLHKLQNSKVKPQKIKEISTKKRTISKANWSDDAC